jgi:hypothetical protein
MTQKHHISAETPCNYKSTGKKSNKAINVGRWPGSAERFPLSGEKSDTHAAVIFTASDAAPFESIPFSNQPFIANCPSL